MRRLYKEYGYGSVQEPMIYYPTQPAIQPIPGMQMAPMSQQQMMMTTAPNMIVIDPDPMTPARMQDITSANRMKSMQQVAAQGFHMHPESIAMGPAYRPVSPSPRVNPMMQLMADPTSQRKNIYQQPQQPRERQGISLERPVSRNNMLELSENTNKAARPNSSRGNIPVAKRQQSVETAERTTAASDSFKVVNKTSVLTFQECVNLLHYCRLIYKTAMQLTRT